MINYYRSYCNSIYCAHHSLSIITIDTESYGLETLILGHEYSHVSFVIRRVEFIQCIYLASILNTITEQGITNNPRLNFTSDGLILDLLKIISLRGDR